MTNHMKTYEKVVNDRAGKNHGRTDCCGEHVLRLFKLPIVESLNGKKVL